MRAGHSGSWRRSAVTSLSDDLRARLENRAPGPAGAMWAAVHPDTALALLDERDLLRTALQECAEVGRLMTTTAHKDPETWNRLRAATVAARAALKERTPA